MLYPVMCSFQVQAGKNIVKVSDYVCRPILGTHHLISGGGARLFLKKKVCFQISVKKNIC